MDIEVLFFLLSDIHTFLTKQPPLTSIFLQGPTEFKNNHNYIHYMCQFCELFGTFRQLCTYCQGLKRFRSTILLKINQIFPNIGTLDKNSSWFSSLHQKD